VKKEERENALPYASKWEKEKGKGKKVPPVMM